ncbi:hypothetical protein Tsubulata_000905 [Turnera subulata]|uniref:NAC domain-containing protein n=1 Tax=Turnera subulata TaxID=218843 RepID=A0A9Q0F5I3_9ROSI|nr:hypothetical protein Tsubulata_000905 [Turnera subulata]
MEGDTGCAFEIPVGYCFNPSVENIVGHYLLRKIHGLLSLMDRAIVKEHDIYEEEPWQIWDSCHASLKSFVGSSSSSSTDDLEFVYFYTKWKNVSDKGERKLRTVGRGGGKWHEESKAETNVLVNGNKLIALKRKFTYQGSLCPPRSWSMTEFSLKDSPNDYVICKLNHNKRSPPPPAVVPPLPLPSRSPPVAVKQPTAAPLNKKRKSSSTSATATSWSKKTDHVGSSRKCNKRAKVSHDPLIIVDVHSPDDDSSASSSTSTVLSTTADRQPTPQEDIVFLPTVNVSGQYTDNDHQEESPSLLIEAERTDIEVNIPWDNKWDTECLSSGGFHDLPGPHLDQQCTTRGEDNDNDNGVVAVSSEQQEEDQAGFLIDIPWDTEYLTSGFFEDNQYSDLGPNFWDDISCFV